MRPLQVGILISVLLLLVLGHLIAESGHLNKETAWMYVAFFYTAWIIASLFVFLNTRDIKKMFSRPENKAWYLLFLPVVIAIFICIFLPNRHLIQWDHWLLMNLIICLVNPFMEEIYWRGLVSRISDAPLASFLFSTTSFAVSHAWVLGVNSPGVAGYVGFAGSFVVGTLFWWCYYKTKSLWGCVIAHFFIDVVGMAVYILADKAFLAPLAV